MTKKDDERKFEGFSGHGDSINGELGSDLIYTKYRLWENVSDPRLAYAGFQREPFELDFIIEKLKPERWTRLNNV